MTYFITPGVGMSLATPSTAQTFETPVVNNNFILLENGILADRVRLSAGEGRTGIVADLDALIAIATPVSGWVRVVVEGGAEFEYGSGKWMQKTVATFANGAARDTAYNKASGQFKTQYAVTTRPDVFYGPEQWFDLYNVSTNAYGATPAGWYPPYGSGDFVQEYVLTANNAWVITTRNTGAIASSFNLPCLGTYEIEFMINRGASAASGGDINFAINVIGVGDALTVNFGDDILAARNNFNVKFLYTHTNASFMSIQARADALYVAAGTKTFYLGSRIFVRYLRPRHA